MPLLLELAIVTIQSRLMVDSKISIRWWDRTISQLYPKFITNMQLFAHKEKLLFEAVDGCGTL